MATYRSRSRGTGRLNPEQIRTAALAFEWTTFGRRGYRPDDVHALLDRLAAEVITWTRQVDILQAENDRLKHALRTWPRTRP